MHQKVLAVFLVLTLGLSLLIAKEEVPVHAVEVQEQQHDPLQSLDASHQDWWVDSVFNSLSFEERLGQLFMVAAYSNKDHRHKEEISRLVREHHIGGLIFFQGGPVRQAHLTNHYQ